MKEESRTTLSAFRIPKELKKEAQIFAINNNTNLTEIVLKGIKLVIKQDK